MPAFWNAMNRERQDVILGGGLAGLTAAYTFQRAGEHHWQVYEREERVGGLARTLEVKGYKFDFGPHILFTIDAEMEELIRELLGENFCAQERRAWIYHLAHDLYSRFPFQAHLHGLPVEVVEECLVGLVRAVERQARSDLHPANYEEWMRGVFGDGIAEHLMIPYAKKIWTVDPATMDFSWTGRRVPTPQVERIVRGALTDDVGSTGETARFWYPKTGGIEQLPRALGKRVNNVHLRRSAERIELPERRVIFADGNVVSFQDLVYTLPLPFLPHLVAGLPAEIERACAALRYQGVHCVNLGIDREHITNKHWIYFYEDSFPFHRLSFPANFSSDGVPPGKSSISAEVAFSKWQPLEPEQAAERTVEALRLAGILASDDTVELIHTETIRPAQVIYGPDDRKNIAMIREWLCTHGIHIAGRFGEWQYLNMDHSMRSGKNVAKAILGAR